MVKTILSDIKQKVFWESEEGTQNTTNFFGWYALINVKSGKINIGSSANNFSRRKADYQRDFREFIRDH